MREPGCGPTGSGTRRPWREGGNGSGVAWSAGPGQLWRNLSADPILSPDSTLEASIQNFNVAVRKVGPSRLHLLSLEGSEGNTYTHRSLVWSPDSRKIAVYRVIPGYPREVHYVESSPEDQLQPKHSTLSLRQARRRAGQGDAGGLRRGAGSQIIVDDALFPNAYDLSRLEWREDSRPSPSSTTSGATRSTAIIEVDAETGAARAVISEEPETFFDYFEQDVREEIDDGREIIWMSERDGWNHLYLYDGATGQVKNQITQGRVGGPGRG